MQGQLKVTPEELRAASSEFAAADGKVTNITSEMMALVTSLTSSWEGEASQAYINRFRTLEDSMQKIHNKILEHTNDLEEMARIYSETEGSLEGQNQAIPNTSIT